MLVVVGWCWDDVGAVIDDASELPVGLTSVVSVPLLGTFGADPEISSPSYFCRSPYHFLLNDLDPENVTLATLVNFPTVSVWLDLKNITLDTLVNFPTVSVWLDLKNITLATLVMFLSVRK